MGRLPHFALGQQPCSGRPTLKNHCLPFITGHRSGPKTNPYAGCSALRVLSQFGGEKLKQKERSIARGSGEFRRKILSALGDVEGGKS